MPAVTVMSEGSVPPESFTDHSLADGRYLCGAADICGLQLHPAALAPVYAVDRLGACLRRCCRRIHWFYSDRQAWRLHTNVIVR